MFTLANMYFSTRKYIAEQSFILLLLYWLY
jgi:hypothetical protein